MISHSIDTLTEDPIVDTLTWTASEDGIAKGRYFVFLADTGSASCAELMLVGAISNTKSPVVGLTTYGKGIGQSYLGTYANGIAGITSMRMLDKNKKDVWYQENAEVAIFWNLAEQVIRLIDSVNKGIKADGTLKELVEWYAASGCEADGAFRKYHTERLGDMSMPRQEKQLTEYLNTQYRDFTERAVKIYQDSILQVKDEKELRNQGCLEIVYPALKEGKRVVLVTVDAFRYEMGKTFAERIERSFRDRVSFVPKVSYLPSVTRFGMANHLGDIVLCVQDGKLEPMIEQDIVSTTTERINYLKKAIYYI